MRRTADARTFAAVIQARLTRRILLRGAPALPLVGFLGCRTFGLRPEKASRLGFSPVPISRADRVVVPPGYEWNVVCAWGDPLLPGAPTFIPDARQSADDQAGQAGMHHDGMAYFPLSGGDGDGEAVTRALLAINFEYTDDNLLTTEGREPWTAEKARKSKNAHGLGVLEVRFIDGRWSPVASSRYGRRITADTPMTLRGPAAGHPWMKTRADPEGRTVLGTFSNCSGGQTPWGTFLSCEENVTPYFVNDSGDIPRRQRRYGVGPSAESWGYRWHEFDERFDAARHPHEPHRHGWVVEVDPYDPGSTPVKRTALGRMAHEGATVTAARDGRVVVYMGDDDFRSKFEHIYKFVSRRPYLPAGRPEENRNLLDEGTLFAARFDADGRGVWLPLVHGAGELVAAHGFASQAEVLIDARTAADRAGATHMDRPEWTAVHPETGEVYCSLSNNSARGTGKPFGWQEPLGADAANPRAPNPMGHIVRWREEGGDAAAARFEWDVFLQAGDPEHPEPSKRGTVKGGVAFAQPDGLAFDRRGVLWIQTDSSAQNMATPDWERIGHNQMLAVDPVTGEARRFLTGPVGAEITGVAFSPGMRTLFVNIQHPGEPPSGSPPRNDPARPCAHSAWPDGPTGRPRSATIAVRRTDGGVIGT